MRISLQGNSPRSSTGGEPSDRLPRGRLAAMRGELENDPILPGECARTDPRRRRPFSMTSCDDPFGLRRFVDAQDPVIEAVRAELAAGRKAGHWMWFVFPQIAGLGRSPMAVRYAIGSRQEAAAYLAHPVLGSRLGGLTAVVNAVDGRPAREIFGSPDDLKFRSCMTLFAEAAGDATVFTEALGKYFGGAGDPLTLDRLSRARAAPS
jgi:uncharacterized protein (DUF1810 family)